MPLLQSIFLENISGVYYKECAMKIHMISNKVFIYCSTCNYYKKLFILVFCITLGADFDLDIIAVINELKTIFTIDALGKRKNKVTLT